MTADVMVDSNVLLYGASAAHLEKHRQAMALIRHLGPERRATSTQCLSEFANVMTHPAKFARTPSAAAYDIDRILRSWTVHPVTPTVILAALEARARWGLAFYDAQVWAVAALNAVPIVASEDFSDGQILGGVRFVNPFTPGFDPESL